MSDGKKFDGCYNKDIFWRLVSIIMEKNGMIDTFIQDCVISNDFFHLFNS